MAQTKKNKTGTVIGVAAVLALVGIGLYGWQKGWFRRKKEEVDKTTVDALKSAYDNLHFDVGTADIRTESLTALDALSSALNESNDWILSISGHTDNTGTEPFNQRLSEQRANAVKNYLASKGVDPSKITVSGFGSTQPLMSNDTPEGREHNRRVEFLINKVA